METLALLKVLKRVLPNAVLLSRKEDLICYGYDGTRAVHLPQVVARPRTRDDVVAIVSLAGKEGFPIYPRGAGTGLTGGAVPVKGGVVLDMTSMSRLLSIDREEMTARVEPGLITGELQRQAEAVGLFFPPDPASAEFSTIGGNVAAGAGGLRCVKYGTTRDYVLSLEVVLPTGEVIRAGSRALKSVTGYDLARIFVGSEGTLGIFTEILLRLIPEPPALKTLVAQFDGTEPALRSLTPIFSLGFLPRAVEFVEGDLVTVLQSYRRVDFLLDGKPLLLLEVDGEKGQVSREIEALEEVCKREGSLRVKVAQNEGERKALWDVRRSVSAAVYSVCLRKVSEDICVPRGRLLEVLSRIKTISKQTGIPILCYGHAGDGNLHVNFLIRKEEDDEAERVEDAVQRKDPIILS